MLDSKAGSFTPEQLLHTHTCMLMHGLMHLRQHVNWCMHAHTSTFMHIYVHMFMHMHAQTHTHTHTRSSLCTHAFHCVNSEYPDIHVLGGWMPAIKIHPARVINEEGMWLPLWLDWKNPSHMSKNLTKNGESQRYSWECSRSCGLPAGQTDSWLSIHLAQQMSQCWSLCANFEVVKSGKITEICQMTFCLQGFISTDWLRVHGISSVISVGSQTRIAKLSGARLIPTTVKKNLPWHCVIWNSWFSWSLWCNVLSWTQDCQSYCIVITWSLLWQWYSGFVCNLSQCLLHPSGLL